MKRFQLFEFCDQAWLPSIVHEAFHDCLGFIQRIYRPFYGGTKLILEHSTKLSTGGQCVYLDLASGSGEQVPTLHRVARGLAVDKKSMPKFVLSDLYPLVKDWKRLQQELGEDCLGYIDAPVSIAQVPETVSRHWTIFSAFHHLPPSLARQLMQQVFEKANSLHIAETTRRHWLNILSVLLNAPTLVLAPFFANRFSFAKLVITTLIRKRSTPPHQLSQDLC